MSPFAKQQSAIVSYFPQLLYVDLKSATHFVILQHFKNSENLKMHFLLPGYAH